MDGTTTGTRRPTSARAMTRGLHIESNVALCLKCMHTLLSIWKHFCNIGCFKNKRVTYPSFRLLYSVFRVRCTQVHGQTREGLSEWAIQPGQGRPFFIQTIFGSFSSRRSQIELIMLLVLMAIFESHELARPRKLSIVRVFKEMPSEVINGPNTTYVRRPRQRDVSTLILFFSYLAPTISLSNSRPMAPSLALVRVFV